MDNLTKITLGELLSSGNMAIRRNATGILKQLQKEKKIRCNNCYSTFHNDDELIRIGDMLACPKCKTDEYLMDL